MTMSNILNKAIAGVQSASHAFCRFITANETKYLFTLQQGVSKNQLREMRHENLKLVVPAPYRNSFDKEFQDDIETLTSFINMVKTKQGKSI